MKTIKSLLCIAIASVSIAGCADHSDKIEPTYVSPLIYDDYSCKQIRGEMVRLSHKVNEIAGAQDKTAHNDSVAMGVGLILFWPSLFFISGHDQHVQLAELKGQYDALQETAIKKDCEVAKELEEGRKMEEERKAKEQTPAPQPSTNK